jgi:outer membrane protein TolC
MTAEKQYEAKKQRLFHQVKVGYYELYYLRRSISITEDNIELLKHLESVAQAKYRAGATVAGVIKAQIELGKLADRLRSLNDVRGPVVARLNAALNRPAEAPLPWPQDVRFNEIELDGTKLLSALRDSNPELLGLDFVLSKEERAIGLARKAAYPGLMLGVDYIDTGDADDPGVLDSGKDPLLAKIALDLPVWRGKNRSAVIEAERRRDAAAQERVERGNRLAADLSMVVYKHRDAERKIDLYRDTLIPQAEQSLNVTEEAYRTGSVDFLSLIDAHRLLLEFQLSHERALVDRAQQLSKIEMIVGIDLSNKEGTP